MRHYDIVLPLQLRAQRCQGDFSKQDQGLILQLMDAINKAYRVLAMDRADKAQDFPNRSWWIGKGFAYLGVEHYRSYHSGPRFTDFPQLCIAAYFRATTSL